MHYSMSDNSSSALHFNKSPTIHLKTYSNIMCNYCQLVKKKVIYANSTNEMKVVNVTSMN